MRKSNCKSLVIVSGLLLMVALFFAIMSEVRGNILASGEVSNFKKIIIDAGHGGIDGGAVGVDGIIEKDLNLAISFTFESS